MKKLLQLLTMTSACLFGAGAWAATEVVATFKDFSKGAQGGYSPTLGIDGTAPATATVTISDKPLVLTRSAGWSGKDKGITVLMKYSSLTTTQTTENQSLITSSATGMSTALNTSALGVSVKTVTSSFLPGQNTGTKYYGYCFGVFNGSLYDSSNNRAIPNATGYILWTYSDDTQTWVYDGFGSVLYSHSSLKATNGQVGEIICLGGLAGGTLLADGLVIEGVRIYDGVIGRSSNQNKPNDVVNAIKNFEMVEYTAADSITTAKIAEDYAAHDYWNGKDEIWVKVPAGATITFSTDTTLPNSVRLYSAGDVTFLKGEGVEDVTTELAKIDVTNVAGKIFYKWLAYDYVVTNTSGTSYGEIEAYGIRFAFEDAKSSITDSSGKEVVSATVPDYVDLKTMYILRAKSTTWTEGTKLALYKDSTLLVTSDAVKQLTTTEMPVPTDSASSGWSKFVFNEPITIKTDADTFYQVRVMTATDTATSVKMRFASNPNATDSNVKALGANYTTIVADTFRPGIRLEAFVSDYSRAVSGANNNWSAEGAWAPASSAIPGTDAPVVLTVAGESQLAMNEASGKLFALTITGDNVAGTTDKLIFTGGGDLTATTTVIETDTDFSGLTGAVNLGAVTVADGVTLTAGQKTTFTRSETTGRVVYLCSDEGQSSATTGEGQASHLKLKVPVGNGLKEGDTVYLKSIKVGLGSSDAADTKVSSTMMYIYDGNEVEAVPTADQASSKVSSMATVTTASFLLKEGETTSHTAATFNFEDLQLVVGREYRVMMAYSNYKLYSFSSATFPLTTMTGITDPALCTSSSVAIGYAMTYTDKIYVPAGGTYHVTAENVSGLSSIGDGATLVATAEDEIDLSNVTFGANVVLKVTGVWGALDASPFKNVPEGVSVTYALDENLPEGVLKIDPATGIVTENVEPLPYQITWMPMGDSITEGEYDMGQPEGTGSDATRGGYRYQLWNYLENGVGEGSIQQDIRTVGYRRGHGADAPRLENPAEDWSWHAACYGARITPLTTSAAQLYNVETAFENAGYPEIVSLMIGINDLAFLRTNTNGAQMVFDSWTNLVQKIATVRPHSKIVVSTVLPVYAGNDGETHYAAFNKKVRDGFAAKENERVAPFNNPNVIFVDVSKLAFNDTFKTENYKDATNVHPNETGSKLVAKAFRLGFLKAIKDIQDEEKTPLAIAQVHNGVQNKVIVRLNKAVNPQDYDMLTLALDGKSSAMLDKVTSDSTELTRELYFDASLYDFTFGQFNEATIKNFASTSIQAITSNANTHMDICGSGAAKNVPDSFRGRFTRYKTIEIGLNNGALGDGNADKETYTALTTTIPNNAVISRVGYYLELKRENLPAQFIWVSMDATAFGNSIANVGIPTTSSADRKAKVAQLSVYGNRGNFKKEVTSGDGIIEFTKKGWSGDDTNFGVKEAHDGSCGWNDNFDDKLTLGCMQVARIRTPEEGGDEAEMLFAYNMFLHANQTDLGIGSFAVHRADNGSHNSAAYDWTFVGVQGYEAYLPSAYKVRNLEIWVELVPKWTGMTDTSWNTESNWSSNEVPESPEKVFLPAGTPHTLTLTEGNYSNVFVGDGALAIAENAQVTLANANSYSGGTHIAAGAELTITHAQALGTTGAITGSGRIIYPKGSLPTNRNGFKEATGWKGTVVLDTVTLVADSKLTTLGNADSTIEFVGACSGFFANEAANNALTLCESDIILTGTFANDGEFSDKTLVFSGELTGSGIFSHSGNLATYTIQFQKVSNFTGEMQVLHTNARILLGATGTAEAGKIVIAGTANIAAGKTWSANGGVKVVDGGTLKVCVNNTESTPVVGTVSGGLSMAEGSTLQVNLRALPKGVQKVLTTSGNGTVTLNGTTTVSVPNGESTQTVSGWTSMMDTDGVYLRRKGFMLIVK